MKYAKKIFNATVIIGKFFNFIFGLIGIVFMIYLGWKNFNLADLTRLQNYEIGKENISLSTDKIKDEKFQVNLKNVSSDNFLVRIGAISILENMARNYPLEYYWPTVHVFLSYVKHSCDKRLVTKACDGDDIQEIISFLSEGEYDVPHKMSDKIDLSNIMLSDINFRSGKYRFANFQGVIFNNIDFTNANLSHASFEKSIIYNSHFSNADLKNTNFSGSKLKDVYFFASNLQNAKFGGVSFESKSDLQLMQFLNSNVRNVSFCTLYDLETNKLKYKCASGLICNSLKFAKLYDTIELPDYLSSCKYRIEPDPLRLEYKKAINDYQISRNPEKLYNLFANSSIEGRLIYQYEAGVSYK